MKIASQRMRFGLTAQATMQAELAVGSGSIGIAEEAPSFSAATVVWANRFILLSQLGQSGVQVAINLADGTHTVSPTDATWVAGSLGYRDVKLTQTNPTIVKSNTSADVTLNMSFTSASIPTSGNTKSIAIIRPAGMTNTNFAALVISTINGDSQLSIGHVAALYPTSGQTDANQNIRISRKEVTNILINSSTVVQVAAADPTFSITANYDNVISGVQKSVTGNAQVETKGLKAFNESGKDFEGATIGTLSKYYGLYIKTERTDYGASLNVVPAMPALALPAVLTTGKIQQEWTGGVTPAGTLTIALGSGAAVTDVRIALLATT